MRPAARSVLRLAAVAAAYVLAGKLGLALAFVAGGSPAWPPAGIATGALLVFGPRVWPAIAAGAFVLNVVTSGQIFSSLVIALGNTVGNLTCWWLVTRYAGGISAFSRVGTVMRFAAAAFASAAVPGLVGVLVLRIFGFAGPDDELRIWLTWLLGEFVGIVLGAPAIALWSAGASLHWPPRRALEFAAVLLVTGFTSWLVFGNSWVGESHYPIPFLVLPALLWPAFRLGARETVTTTLLISLIAITGSVLGFGPFARPDVDESLRLVQVFLAVCAVGALAVASEVGRREAIEADVRTLNEDLEHRVSVRAQELVRAHAALRRTRVRHVAAMRRVQARIASDLHDSVGASLSRIAILSDVALRESEAGTVVTTSALSKIGDNARAVIDEMSDAVWFVDPRMENLQQMVVRLRMVAAALFESNGTDWEIDAAPEMLSWTMTSDQRRHLFLVLKEALTNVHRHAQATVVRVVITATDSGLCAVIDDNGTGLRPEHTSPGQGNGVPNMQKRARELAGTLSIQSRPEIPGTRIVIDVPLLHRDPASAQSTWGGGPAHRHEEFAGHPVTIARYRILRLIGEGAMGAVYEAEQDLPRRIVALKIIKPGITTPELLRRFEHESQALGRLQHPGIAQIYEAGTADTGLGPQAYFAMEFIRGKRLTDYADEHHLNTRQRMAMMAKVAEAAHHAHQRGLIHRDLKPANILVDETGKPTIVDFGVACTIDSDMHATRQTDMGQLVGTLAYMSPEQVLADPLELDTRSDVYALGVILFELLAGRLPYSPRRTLHENMQAIREHDPIKLGTVNRAYRGDIETIVGKALEKDKAMRYGAAAGLALDIHRYLRDEPIAARPPSASYQLRKFARRNKALVTGVAAVFVVLVAGIITASSQAVKARQAEEKARRAEGVAADKTKDALEQLARANQKDRAARVAEMAATSAQEQTDIALTKRDELTLLAIAQSLASESVRASTMHVDDDRAALLARQAMLFHARVPNESRSMAIEDALQQAARPDLWSHIFLPEHETFVSAVALSRDGVYLASSDQDGKVRVWDLRTPRAAATVLQVPPISRLRTEASSRRVLSLAFSSDGTLASGAWDGLRLWDLRNPSAPRKVQGYRAVRSLAFSPDGALLASEGADGVRLLDVRNPEARPTVLEQAPIRRRGMQATAWGGAVAFSADGLRLAVGDDSWAVMEREFMDPDQLRRLTIRIWKTQSPDTSPVLLQAKGAVYSLAFSSDGEHLAAASSDAGVELWDLRKASATPVVLQGALNARSVAFSPDGAYLATGGEFGHGLRLWNWRDSGSVPVMFQPKQAGVVRSVAFSHDGSRLVSGGDKGVRLWELKSPRVWPALLQVTKVAETGPRPLTSVVFPSDSGRLIYGAGDGAIGTWGLNLSTPPVLLQARQAPIEVMRVNRNSFPSVMATAFSADRRRFAAGGANGVTRIWDLRNFDARPLVLQDQESVISALAFSTDGRWLATASGSMTTTDSSIQIWDLRNPSASPVLVRRLRPGILIYALAFSPDGSRLASGSAETLDYTVQIWDVQNPAFRPLVLLPSGSSIVASLAFSPDGRLLASGNNDGAVRLWDLQSPGTPPAMLQGQKLESGHPDNPVAFSSDGQFLVTGGTGDVRLWDLRNLGTPAVRLESPTASHSVAISSDGNHLAAGGNDGSVRVWRLGTAAAEYLCTRVWRNLSMEEWRLYVGAAIPYERTCPALPPGGGVPRTR